MTAPEARKRSLHDWVAEPSAAASFVVGSNAPPKVLAEVDVAWKYGAASCLHTSKPPAMVEVPTPETRRFCVVVGASADWPKVFVASSKVLPNSVPPAPVASVPQYTFPEVSDLRSQFEAESVLTLSPPVSTTRPAMVEEAVVALILVV